MPNPYYFTDRALQVGFIINLDSENTNHANSKKMNEPKFLELGIETRYLNKILKAMANIHARIINQYKFKYQTVFSARLDKQGEDGQMLDETEFFMQ